MKIFVGQRVTGENSEKLKKFSKKVCQILEEQGNAVYCNVFGEDVEGKSPKEQMKIAFNELENVDTFLGIIKSKKKSEGMIMEMGYVLAKGKKLIIAVKSKIKDSTYLPEMADKLIIFDNNKDLLNKLKEIK